ncbi:non-specific lipid transfer protein GPI-anchored 1 [Daucus carota subsp. sativus]|uniref:Bifunctional inhibitor/plant lipid transfer protein/seed storage helical domain-containing protein n=1 Tax=Daucus carota subsp. sativus TaxID=79200 RepID=A0A166E6P0_DAUCS|nr:PREDICTED: non-specific lipid transfer protein GPI-anchored 1 [Daucus carota subsp. sativus]
MTKLTGYYGIILVVGLIVLNFVAEGADPLEKECADNFQKLTDCLGYATGKGTTPTDGCCKSVSGIKESKPVCLCYIIQQMHTGNNPQLKSLGIQESRLLQLPSACKLANASSSDCPKLLKLPANSPDAAIFADPSPSTATPAASNETSSTTVAKPSDSKSAGIRLQIAAPHLIAGMLVSIFTTVVFFSYA